MKQTAVEWLISELRKPYGDARINEILEKAKEMEKEQMCEFAEEFSMQHTYRGTVEQYYNETFKSE